MPRLHRLLLPLLLALLLGACTAVSPDRPGSGNVVAKAEYQPLRDQVKEKLPALMARYRIPGLSLALVSPTEVLWMEGFGYADRQSGEPATPETLYRAGSLAKPLTALAVMQQVERGGLSLDAPLADYLPGFRLRSRFDAAPVTLRDLLSHHSGLPCDLRRGRWSEAPFTKVAAQLQQEHAAFPPGLVYSYSNLGYTLLGHALEGRVERPFAAHMRQSLLLPLGMTQTRFDSRPPEGLAAGHVGGAARRPLPIRDVPAMGMVSSVQDLARFAAFMLGDGRVGGQPLIGPRTLAAMFRPQNEAVPLDLDIRVGLGWFIEQGPGRAGALLLHGGTTPLFSSQIILARERGLGVVILCNSGDSRQGVEQLARTILLRALGEEHGSVPAAAAAKVRAPEVKWTRPYVTPLGLMTVDTTSRQVHAQASRKSFELISHADGFFGLSVGEADSEYKPLERLRFSQREIGGREVLLVEKEGRRQLFGEALPPCRLTPAWQRHLGRYRIVNPDLGAAAGEFRLLSEGGQLFFEYRLPPIQTQPVRVPLTPVDDQIAFIPGLGRGRGEVVELRGQGGREYLCFSGYRAVRSGH